MEDRPQRECSRGSRQGAWFAGRRGRSGYGTVHAGSGGLQKARTKYAGQATEPEPEVSRRRLESKSLLGRETRAVVTLEDERRQQQAAEGQDDKRRSGR